MTIALIGILGLGFLIFFHELGHFLAARLVGVRVLDFSVGMGKKIFSCSYKGTVYCLRMIPLGGFVKLYGMDQTEGDECAGVKLEKNSSYMMKARWQKSLIIVAGPLFNLILPVMMYFAYYSAPISHLNARLGNITENSAAFNAGLKEGDIITAIDGKEVKIFNDIGKVLGQVNDRKTKVEFIRKGERREVLVELGSVSYLTQLGEIKRRPVLGVSPYSLKSTLGSVASSSQAYIDGFRTGDTVISVNKIEINSFAALREKLRAKVDGGLELLVRNGDGLTRKIALSQKRLKSISSLKAYGLFDTSNQTREYGRIVSVNGEAVIDFRGELANRRFTGGKMVITGISNLGGLISGEIIMKRNEKIKDFKEDLKIYDPPKISFLVELNEGEKKEYSYSSPMALKMAWNKTLEITDTMVSSIKMLITGEVGIKALSGPITIVEFTGRSLMAGFENFIFTMSLLSVNLGILNLLPIPVLDGGHLFFLGIESVIRREVPEVIKQKSMIIGMGILFLMMFVAIGNDLLRLL